jgi:isohexenylglutaconyl-CoA hydratase
MSDYQTLSVEIAPPFAHITLNRPETRNAMNFEMVDELLSVFVGMKERIDIRAVVLSGAGGHFCSGGDIADLAQAASMTPDEQDDVTRRLDAMLRAVNQAPQIVVAKLQGAVLGGGFGLACVSDIAIAAENASFGLPEVRLGLAPALIAPFVIQRIGLTQARRLMLTGERFDGHKALGYGLVHELYPVEQLEGRIASLLHDLRLCAPNAIRVIKALMHESVSKSLDETVAYRAHLLNTIRGGDEGQEGMSAFLSKRKPRWAETL